jgi:hypothetical protein
MSLCARAAHPRVSKAGFACRRMSLRREEEIAIQILVFQV